MRAAVLADSHGVALSTHTAPALHVPLAFALEGVIHAEYFFDHVRPEALLFDGFKHADAQRYAV